MPQQSAAQLHRSVQVAQNDAPTARTATTETVGAKEGPENPLAEHPPLYYSTIGGIVGVGIVLFAVFCKSKGLTTRKPSKRQSLLEQAVASITFFARNAIGPGGEKFAPLIGTVFAFVLVSNLMGVLPTIEQRDGQGGFRSWTPAPTSNLSMTVAISLVVFLYSQYIGIKENGVGGYAKHFLGPVLALSPLMLPLEIVGALAKPVSLSIRLFGNIFGEETVTAVLVGLMLSVLPLWLPIPVHSLMLMFGVFGSVVQAGVFTILTCAYLSLAIGDHDSNGHHHAEDEFGGDTISDSHGRVAVAAH